MVAPKIIRILLVDDHPLVRIGLRTELRKVKDFKIVGEAKTGREAVKKSMLLRPDIILLDIGLPDINGLEATSIIIKKIRDAKIIALTMYNYDNYISEMMKLGAKGYIMKDSPPEELFAGIREVLKGNKYFDKSVRDKAISVSRESKTEQAPLLTKRETEILKNVANGLNNKFIADKFFISIRTVEAHRNRIKNKLGLKSVADLTKYAIRNNIIAMEAGEIA